MQSEKWVEIRGVRCISDEQSHPIIWYESLGIATEDDPKHRIKKGDKLSRIHMRGEERFEDAKG